MKRFWIVCLSLGLLSCQNAEEEVAEVNLEDKLQKKSYAMALEFGDHMKKNVDIDLDAFVQGLRDGYAEGPALLTMEEARKVTLDMEQEEQAKKQAEFNKLAEENKKAGEAFLAENQKKEGVMILESGLQYKVLTEGFGAKPEKNQAVVCHYRGKFLDGTEFDSSYSRGVPTQFRVDRLIPGWTEALQLMPTGSKWELYIPHYLAYGARQTGDIGPNSTLIFELELLEIK